MAAGKTDAVRRADEPMAATWEGLGGGDNDGAEAHTLEFTRQPRGRKGQRGVWSRSRRGGLARCRAGGRPASGTLRKSHGRLTATRCAWTSHKIISSVK